MTDFKKNSGNANPQETKIKKCDFPKRFEPEWIQKRINPQCIIFTEDFGKYLVKGECFEDDNDAQNNKKNNTHKEGMSSSQIRNIFGEVRRIQMGKDFTSDKSISNFLLLRPKIAYAAKRDQSKAMQQFKEVMHRAWDAIEVSKLNLDEEQELESKKKAIVESEKNVKLEQISESEKIAKLKEIAKKKEPIELELKKIKETKEKLSKQFNNFCDFFEAILAFHKANGGD